MSKQEEIVNLQALLRDFHTRLQGIEGQMAALNQQLHEIDPAAAQAMQREFQRDLIVMRSLDRVRYAHDMFCTISAGQLPRLHLLSETRIAIHAAHDALAWVLQFPCAETFQANLDNLMQEITDAGYGVRDTQDPA